MNESGIAMFIVFEIQKNADGTMGTLVTTHEDRNAAYVKFYTVLAAAAQSSVLVHSATLMTERGETLENKTFVHPVEE